MPEIPGVAASVEPLDIVDLTSGAWEDPEHVDLAVLLDRLNTLLVIVQRLEEKVNAIKSGPGGALHGS